MPKFGELENAVMDVVWRSQQSVTVRQVLEMLAEERQLAYTTVQTVMDRLARKGLLVRRLEGKANLYLPRRSREDHTASAMQEALTAAPDTQTALLHFVELMDERQAQALRGALGARRAPGPS